jgi:hypothetical protein
LVIDTVVCLTLAKWETVSGRFGGYLRISFILDQLINILLLLVLLLVAIVIHFG